MPRKRLQAWMKWLGENQTAVALMVDVHPSTISRVLSGEMTPSLELALQLEAVTMDWPKGPIKAGEWVQ